MNFKGWVQTKVKALLGVSDSGARSTSSGTSRTLYIESFDGEKNYGEIGPLTDYQLDFAALRYRSWKSYIDSEIAQTVIQRFTTWVIGSGLKLQSLPNFEVLKQEGVDVDSSSRYFKAIDQRFKVWSNSKMSDYKNEDTFNQTCRTAFINSIIGGDVLVILRVKNGNLNVQLIDAQNVQSPLYTSHLNLKPGHKIENGIETDKKGRVVAYHVKTDGDYFSSERVKAYNNGFRVAYLYKGLRYRMRDRRGVPLIVAVMETISKIERYKEATVGSAEEIAKIAYQIVHQQYSTGENPMTSRLAKAFDSDNDGDNFPVDQAGRQLADKVAATTNKMAFNNPIGAEIKSMQAGGKELYFKDFYTVNWQIICATLQIPPEIAMSLYNSNFSASRAALKDWEHTINVSRNIFDEQFLSPIHELWCYLELLKGKIELPGFLEAVQNRNEYAKQANLSHRFIGSNVPHIDPLKEVKAEREKLGELGKELPLTTLEQATESLNGGDSENNMQQYQKELESFTASNQEND